MTNDVFGETLNPAQSNPDASIVHVILPLIRSFKHSVAVWVTRSFTYAEVTHH